VYIYLAFLDDILSSMPGNSGVVSAIILFILWLSVEVGKVIWNMYKKNEIKTLRFELDKYTKEYNKKIYDFEKECYEKIDYLETEVKLIKANYLSEERFKRMSEDRVKKLEEQVYLGNGQKSLTNRISVLESKIEQLKK